MLTLVRCSAYSWSLFSASFARLSSVSARRLWASSCSLNLKIICSSSTISDWEEYVEELRRSYVRRLDKSPEVFVPVYDEPVNVELEAVEVVVSVVALVVVVVVMYESRLLWLAFGVAVEVRSAWLSEVAREMRDI